MVREHEILPKIISDIESEVGGSVDVRVTGQDAIDNNVSLPEVIIDWRASRLPLENGHNSHGSVNYDNSGDKTGYEHHSYWSFQADCLIRYYDEIERDKVADSVQMAFLPYESNAEAFHKDTREWQIGAAEQRPMLAVEPDWYEWGVVVEFEYLKRVDEPQDTIETVNDTVDNDETLDGVNTDLQTN